MQNVENTMIFRISDTDHVANVAPRKKLEIVLLPSSQTYGISVKPKVLICFRISDSYGNAFGLITFIV